MFKNGSQKISCETASPQFIFMDNNINREAFEDLMHVREEDAIVESLELMQDKDFMKSYKKAKEEIKNREFVDWDEL